MIYSLQVIESDIFDSSCTLLTHIIITHNTDNPLTLASNAIHDAPQLQHVYASNNCLFHPLRSIGMYRPNVKMTVASNAIHHCPKLETMYMHASLSHFS